MYSHNWSECNGAHACTYMHTKMTTSFISLYEYARAITVLRTAICRTPFDEVTSRFSAQVTLLKKC